MNVTSEVTMDAVITLTFILFNILFFLLKVLEGYKDPVIVYFDLAPVIKKKEKKL